MFKYCITGHCGLIGTALKERLDKEGNECILSMDLREGKDIRYDFPIGDHHADIMFHLASNCKVNKCISNPEWCFENVEGIHKVLEFCRNNNIKKIVAFSSSRVLSKERNPYTASKYYLEELCKTYADCYGIQYIIIRPSTVYSPFDDQTHRLIDIWIKAGLCGDNLKIYGNPKTKTLDFTYIDDFVDGVMLILKVNAIQSTNTMQTQAKDKLNETYNLSGGEEYNLKRLAEFIIKETKSESKIALEPMETQQPQKVNVDISKIKELGYCPKVDIKEGTKRTIKFYKNLLQQERKHEEDFIHYY